MCTPWTLSKLLSCRPCFSKYDSTNGMESETLPSAMADEPSNRSVIDRKAFGRTGFGREPIDVTLMTAEKGLPDKNRKYELHWHSGFEDEHYIVLCFDEEESVDQEEDESGELEAIHKSGNVSERSDTDSPGDDDEQSSVRSTQTKSHAKDDERMENGSIGPRYSDESVGSKGSFSFPELHEEWIGSPVQMPRPDDFYSRNSSGIHVRFQCCKF